jgi:membrane fusion protein, heavy metal efflux system
MNHRFAAAAIPLWIAAAITLAPVAAFAHEGHDHGGSFEDEASANGEAKRGPISRVELSAAALRNLDLKTAPAEIITMARSLHVTGTIKPTAGSRAGVTAAAAGKVSSLRVEIGRQVKRGDTLLVIGARQIAGSPVPVAVTAMRRGRVARLDVVAGSSVEVGSPLLEIADFGEVIGALAVFETDAVHLRIGQPVRLWPVGLSGNGADTRESSGFDAQGAVQGVIEDISPEVDAQSRRVEARMRVKNPDGRFRLNMAIEAEIMLEAGEEVIAVPKEAILRRGGESFVFIAETPGSNLAEGGSVAGGATQGGAFIKTPVTLGKKNQRFVEIVEGVMPGDDVVVQGQYQLQFVKPRP